MHLTPMKFQLKSIDNVVAGEKVTFIKMDIEGSRRGIKRCAGDDRKTLSDTGN
jgi:hypothetical protein